MSRGEFEQGYGDLLRANGITNFYAYEFADVGRRSSGGAVLQVPPQAIWQDSIPVWHVLEWLRSELGDRPITVTSGYRDREYNRSIGGATHSQHVLGTARDVVVAGVEPRVVADTLERHPNADQLGIGRYPDAGFTHVDTRGRKARWGNN